VRADVVIGGHGVEDEIEAAGVLLHLISIAGENDLVGAQTQRVFFFARRGSEDDNVRSERVSKFYRHVPESAKTDHANFLALRDAPVMHRRVGRDPGTEQRRSSGEVEVGWDAQNEMFVDNDAARVPTVGETSEVFVRGVESEGHVGTELLKAGFALRTGTVRINHAADRGDVTRLEFGHGRADPGNTADNLMAGHNRVIRGHELAPLVADRMKIGVTDATEYNSNFDILGTRFTTQDTKR